MTADEAKDLATWMRESGAVQFTFDGLSVSFHPRSVGLGTAPLPAGTNGSAASGVPVKMGEGAALPEWMGEWVPSEMADDPRS